VQEITLTDLEADQRLDRYLRKLLPTVPLGAIFRYLRRGDIRVDGNKVRGDLRLQAGMKVTLALPAKDLRQAPPDAADTEPVRPDAQEFDPFDLLPPLPEDAKGAGDNRIVPAIVLRDEQFLVVDKPAGLAVHPGTGNDWSLIGWLATQRVGVRTATFAPAPAHRLDRGTSGLVIVGLVPEAMRTISEAFREGNVHKVYFAVVHGVPQRPQGGIVAPLWQDPDADPRLAKVVVDKRGTPARTDYVVVKTSRNMALLRVVPHTGRQHQIRAHLMHLGHPIVGDRRYGSVAEVGDGFLLHAAELRFPHPQTGRTVRCAAPLPRPFHRFFEAE
jgi:23S rRNA pseudouridine955/2504/2580 synthase